MDVGLELRQARERRGLSLQRLSSTTKISPRVLQAIETCDERQLPAWVFTHSFVKCYATEVGLDPEDTVHRYLDQFAQPAQVEGQTVEPAAVAVPKSDAAGAEHHSRRMRCIGKVVHENAFLISRNGEPLAQT